MPLLTINISLLYFSGEASATNGDDTPSGIASGLHPATSALALSLAAASANGSKNKVKRKGTLIQNHIDKMLSDRMSLADSKKFCDINATAAAVSNSSASLIYDKFKSAESAMDYFNKSGNGDVMNVVNNNNSISNNNSIKSERLSPPQQHLTNGGTNGDAQSLNSR